MCPIMGEYTKPEADVDIAAHAALTTGVHGVGTGLIVGTDLAQALTNKTLTSPKVNEDVVLTALATDLNNAASAKAYSFYSAPILAAFAGVLTVNSIYVVRIMVHYPCTLTGILVHNDATINGNLLVALYKADGSVLLASSGSTAQSGAWSTQSVPFSTPYAASCGVYLIGLVSSSATAIFQWAWYGVPCRTIAVGSFAVPATVTAPSTVPTSAVYPSIGTY